MVTKPHSHENKPWGSIKTWGGTVIVSECSCGQRIVQNTVNRVDGKYFIDMSDGGKYELVNVII